MAEKLNILVLDDEAGIREGIKAILGGFHVVSGDTGDKVAFDIKTADTIRNGRLQIESYNPDLILIDYKLPDGLGTELINCPEIKKSNALPIIMTAYASLDVAIESTRLGAFDFLPKPFTSDELKHTVTKAAKHIFLDRKARKLEEEKRKVKFEFVSVLAHELKSPLNAVIGYLDILQNAPSSVNPDKSKDILCRCRNRMDGMSKLIHDLLDLTRIESGEKERHISPVDLKALLEDAVEMFRDEAKNRNIKISSKFSGEANITADAGDITIIVRNLVSNAVKYNKDGGSVSAEMCNDGANISISVSDTGIGLSNEDTKKLFKDFSRIKNPETSAIDGSGLGLSTVKKIAGIYGGDVSVVSKKESGSTFKVVLPIANLNVTRQ